MSVFSLSDVRGLDLIVCPLVVDVQIDVQLVHDAHGNLLRTDGGKVIVSSEGWKHTQERDARTRKHTRTHTRVFYTQGKRERVVQVGPSTSGVHISFLELRPQRLPACPSM